MTKKTLSEIILNNLLLEREYAIASKNDKRREELQVKIDKIKGEIEHEKNRQETNSPRPDGMD
ncbi:hypothetical protein UFOVP138_13 [uncultured Caudovirales phage]|uniref:Uncharacterized protein n=1 Tax=uncultured Caudovirales phage TaxID=2100421 RepID=A0A6J5LCL8_9CAUD|nr:hypothetical protein UFOVP138_13 [uncultured Caudovirales phage]